tara:strand:+ start:1266 stop:1406 length:141 start_codon:yes stop_codon:yes gene_type:complete
MSLKLDLSEIKYVLSTFDCGVYYIIVVQDSNGKYLYMDVKYNMENV